MYKGVIRWKIQNYPSYSCSVVPNLPQDVINFDFLTLSFVILQIPQVAKGQLMPLQTVHIHIIKLQPEFNAINDLSVEKMIKMYTSDTCFGIISAQPLPLLCKFPVYVNTGEICVELAVNQNTVLLTSEQILEIREYHTLVLNNVLEVLKTFLVINNSADAEMLLLVPLSKNTGEINFDIVSSHKSLKSVLEPSGQERASLQVTEEEFLEKIVVPWYRPTKTVSF